jgi:small subunit ribosomal protein S16
MATRIRLARYGTKKKPFYRIVVADQRRPRDGRFIEILGSYDPSKGTAEAAFDSARLAYWLKQGAQATDTVRKIIGKGLGDSLWRN